MEKIIIISVKKNEDYVCNMANTFLSKELWDKNYLKEWGVITFLILN